MNGMSPFCLGLEKSWLIASWIAFQCKFPLYDQHPPGRIEGSCLRSRRRDYLEFVNYWDSWIQDRLGSFRISGSLKYFWNPCYAFGTPYQWHFQNPLYIQICQAPSPAEMLYPPLRGRFTWTRGFLFMGGVTYLRPFHYRSYLQKLK